MTSPEEAADRRRRLALAAGAALAFVVIVGAFLLLSAPDEGPGDAAGGNGNAFIQPLSGSANGVKGDERVGAEVQEVREHDLSAAAEEAGCELELDLPDEGSTHLRPEQPSPDYDTNPPTSGDHIVPPLQQADGAYSEAPAPVNYVHSLEHGRVEIQYSPELPEADQLALKGVFDADPAGMLLFPNPEMPYEVAVTAWTQLMGCATYEASTTLDAVRAFREAYRGNGPEPVPIQLSG